MKLDIVRAWKDEGYRQTLSDEQLSALSANPAGELTYDELEAIYGGGGAPLGLAGPGGFGGGGVGAFGALGAFGAQEESFFQSVAIECENNRFSFNFSRNFNFLSDNDTICVNGN